MKIKLNRHGLFDQTWRWTYKEIDMVKEALNNTKSPILHVCSGNSNIGDIRIDRVFVDLNKDINLAPKHKDDRGKANILGNMLELPFKDSSFPTIICDPPYGSVKLSGAGIK